MNDEIFQLINRWAGHFSFLDTIMVVASNSVPYISVAVVLFLWFYRKGEKGVERPYTALYTALTALLALSVNVVIHLVYYHPRPFVVHHVHQLLPHSSDSSFVSDHAVLAFSIAWMLLFRRDRWGYPAFVWAIVVGISRVFVGVHYPADVAGSMVLSGVMGIFVILLSKSKRFELFAQFLFRLDHTVIKYVPFLQAYCHKELDKKG
ncbi:undecaprenyl-diphosphatase [Geobacillus sp. C56-T3]|uniref:undecaprenyl-diphosphatase n=1 Tax=Geobacillus sp. (strain C56-T3) TaxID=691437 RepID=UPI0001D583A6|nr:undecaprenyl-diphosphatase [Geobacillus sp. C56-T3]ADI27899.1 phosphoesterase PA-phosphatase related protein [Geobacillus sp. C56-T3]